MINIESFFIPPTIYAIVFIVTILVTVVLYYFVIARIALEIDIKERGLGKSFKETFMFRVLIALPWVLLLALSPLIINNIEARYINYEYHLLALDRIAAENYWITNHLLKN